VFTCERSSIVSRRTLRMGSNTGACHAHPRGLRDGSRPAENAPARCKPNDTTIAAPFAGADRGIDLTASAASSEDLAPSTSRTIETSSAVPAFARMADQDTRQRPICAACNKPMTFIDAVSSPDGAMAIFRCSQCNKTKAKAKAETKASKRNGPSPGGELRPWGAPVVHPDRRTDNL
jgi:hypothetical protein